MDNGTRKESDADDNVCSLNIRRLFQQAHGVPDREIPVNVVPKDMSSLSEISAGALEMQGISCIRQLRGNDTQSWAAAQCPGCEALSPWRGIRSHRNSVTNATRTTTPGNLPQVKGESLVVRGNPEDSLTQSTRDAHWRLQSYLEGSRKLAAAKEMLSCNCYCDLFLFPE